jgi:hypothetical protein
LSHKFAFVCYKNPDSARRAVNEVPYLRISDKTYNEEVERISQILNKLNFENE